VDTDEENDMVSKIRAEITEQVKQELTSELAQYSKQ